MQNDSSVWRLGHDLETSTQAIQERQQLQPPSTFRGMEGAWQVPSKDQFYLPRLKLSLQLAATTSKNSIAVQLKVIRQLKADPPGQSWSTAQGNNSSNTIAAGLVESCQASLNVTRSGENADAAHLGDVAKIPPAALREHISDVQI